MNRVILIGRLTKDPDMRQTNNGAVMARYTLAVERRYNGENMTDFIGCVAYGKGGEFAQKYFSKGMKVAVQGRIQTGSYTNKDGNRVNTFDVVIDSQEFVESKMNNMQTKPANDEEDDFMKIPDGIGDELPFH